MPVLQKVKGETFRSVTPQARLVELSERDLFRSLLEVVAEADALKEMAHYIAEEGSEIRLSAETKDLIAKATSAMVDLTSGEFTS
jgi:hypothetical protein